MARWSRAKRLLALPPGSRVLDLGCAFGFGTGMLTGRYDAYGHDLNPAYIDRAHRSVPGATFTQGPADRIPYADSYFDGVLLLDVLEHVPDERAVLREAARVLRPGGVLVLSVPNRGALAALDSLNVYTRLLGRHVPPPTDDPSWATSPLHRHYAERDLERLLGEDFAVRGAYFTGLGVAEAVNLPLLLLLRPWPRLHRVYEVAQYAYFGVYLAEDLLPAGSWGYHLMIRAERKQSGP